MDMMRKHEPILVGGLVALLLLTWLGFPLHASERFAGSLWGGVLAVVGAGLMLVPLAHSIIKRNRRLKERAKRYVSMRTMLTIHIYAGVFGPILVLLHTGHKYDSPLGIALTAMTIIVVVSGFVGRFLVGKVSRTIRAKQVMLKELHAAYQASATDLRGHAQTADYARPFTRTLSRIVLRKLLRPRPSTPGLTPTLASKVATTIELAESIADLEYAIRTHKVFAGAFRIWLRWHITISMVLYVLLALHVWSAIHFGLRWFL